MSKCVNHHDVCACRQRAQAERDAALARVIAKRDESDAEVVRLRAALAAATADRARLRRAVEKVRLGWRVVIADTDTNVPGAPPGSNGGSLDALADGMTAMSAALAASPWEEDAAVKRALTTWRTYASPGPASPARMRAALRAALEVKP